MYSKEELQAKSVVQLKDIAKELGVKVKSGDKKEAVVYAILDAQAEQPASDAAPKRKRTRIATKKEDRVYSVHGNEGENFDVQRTRFWVLTAAKQLLRLRTKLHQPQRKRKKSSSARQSRVYNQQPRSRF